MTRYRETQEHKNTPTSEARRREAMGNTLKRVKRKLNIRPKHVRCTVIISYENEFVEENRHSEVIAERRDSFDQIEERQLLDISAPAGRIILEMETNFASDEEIIEEIAPNWTPVEPIGETKTEVFRRPAPRKVLDWDSLNSCRGFGSRHRPWTKRMNGSLY